MPHIAKVSWTRNPEESFIDNKYSRAHTWAFDGGTVLRASSSPQVVPVPMSDPSAVDPEEAFIASLSSCHLLWFLSLAVERNYLVESYEDDAEGCLGRNEKGKLSVTKVILKPRVRFGGANVPSREQVDELHHAAHEKCFLANSVHTAITIVQR